MKNVKEYIKEKWKVYVISVIFSVIICIPMTVQHRIGVFELIALSISWNLVYFAIGLLHRVGKAKLPWYHNVINWVLLPIAWFVLRKALKERVTFEARRGLMWAWQHKALEQPTKLRRPYFILHTWGVKYYVKEQAKLIKKISKVNEKK